MDTTGKLKLGFAALMILSGIGVAMYPVVSNAVAQRHASAVIDSYDDTVQSMDTEKLDAAKEAARSYNEQLSNAVGRDAAGEAADTGTSYVDLMDVGESLGYIKIPKIDVNLPIYEGTSDEVLLKGVGHLEGSSYPLGGDSTHSVLTGHRGLAEAVLFTDLDKMQEGDKFYLHVMDEVLAYQVDQVKVVEPEHTEDLEIIPGGDYCTLVTCTPYAINTHRMLVRGVRVPYNGEDEDADTPQAVQYQALRTGTVVKRVVDAWPWIAVTGSVVIGGEALLLLCLILPQGFLTAGSAPQIDALGALLLVVLSGLIWFILWRNGSSFAGLALETHKNVTLLIELYLIGHGCMALLHFFVWQRNKARQE